MHKYNVVSNVITATLRIWPKNKQKYSTSTESNFAVNVQIGIRISILQELTQAIKEKNSKRKNTHFAS